MLKGRCLCGQVTYEYQGEITELAVCHCQQCKQAQGTPFVTNAPIENAKMNWLTGTDQFKSYYSSPNKNAYFAKIAAALCLASVLIHLILFAYVRVPLPMEKSPNLTIKFIVNHHLIGWC